MTCLWVPGKFSLTNAMLSNLRAAGHFEGRSRGRAQPGGKHDAYAAEVEAIRLAAKAAARSRSSALAGRWNVGALVLGHYKHDPDAWGLLAKAAIDGLRDAGALASDRFQVGWTWGRVLASSDEAASLLPWFGVAASFVEATAPGLLLVLEQVPGGGLWPLR